MDQRMKRPVVRCYLNFNDPYSFILMPAVKNLGHDFKVDVDYVPLPSHDRAGMFADDRTVREYWSADAARFAKKADRKLIFDDRPMDSTAVSKAYAFAFGQMLGVKYLNLVMALRWVGGKAIDDPEQVIAGLKFLEMDEEKLRDALTGDAYGGWLREAEAKAAAAGVIGTPFFTFEGERFMGDARFTDLVTRLRSVPSLTVHHDAGYAVVKADELAERIGRNEPMLILDIRIPKAFGEGHIPGANCLPAKVVYRNLARLDREWTIVLVDDGGVEGSEAGFFLAGEGFAKVVVLYGGFPAWTGEVATGLDGWQDRLRPAEGKGR